MTRAAATPPTAPGRTPVLGFKRADLSPLLLIARLLAGGAFILAAYMKLRDPQSFSEAIQAFKLVEDDRIVLFSTHALPWIEMFAGIALVLGFWTRAAALIIAGLLVVFIVAILSVLLRHMDVSCGCFGRFRLACPSKIGWCKVVENTVLTMITLLPLVHGGGRLSLDAAMEPDRPSR